MASVQFVGIDTVMKAFDNRALEGWSIFEGKRLVTSGDGSENLRAFLTMMEGGGSTATYLLNIYDGDEIDSSFNFKLCLSSNSQQVGAVRSGVAAASPVSLLHSKIEQMIAAKLDKILARIDEPEEEEEETESFQDMAIGMLKEPDKLIGLINAAKVLFGMTGPQLSGAVGGGVTRLAIDPVIQSQETKLQRLAAAIDTLEKNDPLIVDHLEKLAKISVDSPQMFKGLIATLNNF